MQHLFRKTAVLIPARGGSTRLPGKNIKIFNGRPLIAYSIQYALECGFSPKQIFVSSDDESTLSIARHHGVYQIKRPSKLCQANSSTNSAVKHFLSRLKSMRKRVDFILLLQPTSPLRKLEHYYSAADMMAKTDADSVITISENSRVVGTLLKSGRYSIHRKPNNTTPKNNYYTNGLLYLFRVSSFNRNNDLVGKNVRALVTTGIYSAKDIDTNIDFQVLEFLHRTMK